jgi:hypothetical protein
VLMRARKKLMHPHGRRGHCAAVHLVTPAAQGLR